MAKRQRTNLLRQGKGMRAHDGTERTAAAAELRHPGRAVTRTAGALLLVHLLAGTPDIGAPLRLVSPGLTFGELPVDAALDDVLARLETEDLVGQLNRASRLAFKRCDLQFHLTRPPARPALQQAQPARPRRWPGGTCPASVRPLATPSSRHRVPRSIRPWSRERRLRRGSGRAPRRSARRE